MSKYIDQICESLDFLPDHWKAIDSGAIAHKQDEVILNNHSGMTFFPMNLFPTALVYIKGNSYPMSYRDGLKIERAMTRWYEKVLVQNLLRP